MICSFICLHPLPESSLKGTGPIKNLELDIDDSGDVKINLNDKEVPLTIFPVEIIRNTLAGLTSNLKGVEGKLKTLEIKINQ